MQNIYTVQFFKKPYKGFKKIYSFFSNFKTILAKNCGTISPNFNSKYSFLPTINIDVLNSMRSLEHNIGRRGQGNYPFNCNILSRILVISTITFFFQDNLGNSCSMFQPFLRYTFFRHH